MKGRPLTRRADVTAQDLSTLAGTFRLLGDPGRLKILLHRADGPKAMSDMVAALGLSQSLVSHHLRLFRAARLVTADREARQICCRISDVHVTAAPDAAG